MIQAYYDTSYLFKIQCFEQGTAEVRAHAGTVSNLACSLHGRAEFVSTCHRKWRENAATHPQLLGLLAQLQADSQAGVIEWLPLTEAMIQHVEKVYTSAPASTFLRAADALHLACAAGHGFLEIYSNDRHLLTAAPLFGLRGRNVIPQSPS
jgi:predicted nucleic acid-binding protein